MHICIRPMGKLARVWSEILYSVCLSQEPLCCTLVLRFGLLNVFRRWKDVGGVLHILQSVSIWVKADTAN